MNNNSSNEKNNNKNKNKNSPPSASSIVPSRFDVIVGRGKFCTSHPGNIDFKRIIQSHLDVYANAPSKLDKSIVVSSIIEMVRTQSPLNGGFLKRTRTGEFRIVSDRVAREKVGQALRDSLQSRYLSSSGTRRQRRLREIDAQSQRVLEMLRQNHEINTVMSNVRSEIDDRMKDEEVSRLFDRANRMILLEVKRVGLVDPVEPYQATEGR